MIRTKPTKQCLQRAQTVEDLTKQNIETIEAIERSTSSIRTVGDRIADGFARVVGSWTFIIVQSLVLAIWMVVNVTAWLQHWDPYPFILLNLGLSFQAAFAGPILMMSQNRQAQAADRRNRLDLQINLLAEQENTEMLRLLRLVCERLDIPIAADAAVNVLEQRTEPEKMAEQLNACANGEEEHREADAQGNHEQPQRKNGSRQDAVGGT